MKSTMTVRGHKCAAIPIAHVFLNWAETVQLGRNLSNWAEIMNWAEMLPKQDNNNNNNNDNNNNNNNNKNNQTKYTVRDSYQLVQSQYRAFMPVYIGKSGDLVG